MVSATDLCAYCGGDCPMGSCPVCHGCEDIPCQECDNPDPGGPEPWTPDSDDDWYNEEYR